MTCELQMEHRSPQFHNMRVLKRAMARCGIHNQTKRQTKQLNFAQIFINAENYYHDVYAEIISTPTKWWCSNTCRWDTADNYSGYNTSYSCSSQAVSTTGVVQRDQPDAVQRDAGPVSVRLVLRRLRSRGGPSGRIPSL